MVNKAIPELVKKGNSIIFTGEVLDIYIPKRNFDKKLSSYNGEYISTIGIFLFDIKTQSEADNNAVKVIHKMKMPININFQYSSSYKYKGKLDNYPSDDYEVFRLENGNEFVASTLLEKDSSEVTKFIKALHGGALPKMLSYDEILQLYHQVLEISGVNLGAPSIIYELTISESCRAKNNIKIPFRKYVTTGQDRSRYDYVNTNITKLAMLNSTFGGLTSGNVNDAVLTSIERTQNGDEEQESPLEKISRY